VKGIGGYGAGPGKRLRPGKRRRASLSQEGGSTREDFASKKKVGTGREKRVFQLKEPASAATEIDPNEKNRGGKEKPGTKKKRLNFPESPHIQKRGGEVGQFPASVGGTEELNKGKEKSVQMTGEGIIG